ncbi:MAG: hypothetical protein ACFCUX_06580, partial [Candidatus Methylacidiphilales bacterium]
GDANAVAGLSPTAHGTVEDGGMRREPIAHPPGGPQCAGPSCALSATLRGLRPSPHTAGLRPCLTHSIINPTPGGLPKLT